jgi:hypothetical protein
MASKWIFDPPPAPPSPKRRLTDVPKGNNAQRANYGRGGRGWSQRGQGQRQRQGGGHHVQESKQQWQQNLPGTNMAIPFMPAQTGFFHSGYQQPFPTFQPPATGFPTTLVPQMYAQYPTSGQYPYPPQQYPVTQSASPQPTVPQKMQELPSRKLPVYQSQPPVQNKYGYSMSSTAFSLPSHHLEPQDQKAPELSEEEIRLALEREKAKNKIRSVSRWGVVMTDF